MMTQDNKIRLADVILAAIADLQQQIKHEKPVHVGFLNKVQGIRGFKKCEIGTPVFEITDRYMMYLETVDGKTSVEVKYYKETLSPCIDFIK